MKQQFFDETNVWNNSFLMKQTYETTSFEFRLQQKISLLACIRHPQTVEAEDSWAEQNDRGGVQLYRTTHYGNEHVKSICTNKFVIDVQVGSGIKSKRLSSLWLPLSHCPSHTSQKKQFGGE